MGIVIGIIIVLGLAVFFSVLTIKSKNPDLFKWIGIAIFMAFALTWVLPTGGFQSGVFYEEAMDRLGLADISSVAYYAIYFCLTTVLYLFVVGGFYGVLSKTDGYKVLVKKIGNLVNRKPILLTTIISFLFIAFVSFTTNTYAWILFIPLLVSALNHAKLDKMSIFTTTYGSVLAGILAATYGTGSLKAFNYYIGTETNFGINYRLILALIFTVVYLVFNAIRLRKKLKGKVVNEKDADLFEVEEVTSKRHISSVLPMILFIFLLVIAFVGLFNWSNFNIKIFDDLHTWLTELKVGKDFTIISYILGSSAVPFGYFEITTLMSLLLVLTVLVGLVNRMSVKEFMDNFGHGFAKVLKPVCLLILSYAAFVTVYITPVVPTMINWFVGLTKTYNPFTSTLAGLIASFFHADLGYTGYVVGSLVTTTYENYSALAHTLYVSTYGIAQLILPTSGILLFGLAYLKLDYKSWFKYIWLVAVIAIVALLIFAVIVRYAI